MSKQEFILNKQKKEEQLFEEYAKHKGIRRYHFTPVTCPYDVKFLSGNTYIISETKVRQEYSNDFFIRNGAFLEYKKLDGMLQEKGNIKHQHDIDVSMYYFNFTADSLQIFLLKEPHNYNFVWKYLPKDNYNLDVKVWKLVTTLHQPIEIIPIADFF